jgi:hypothetical protein
MLVAWFAVAPLRLGVAAAMLKGATTSINILKVRLMMRLRVRCRSFILILLYLRVCRGMPGEFYAAKDMPSEWGKRAQ